MQVADGKHLDVQNLSRLQLHLEFLADVRTSKEQPGGKAVNGTKLLLEQHVIFEDFGVQCGTENVLILDGILTW